MLIFHKCYFGLKHACTLRTLRMFHSACRNGTYGRNCANNCSVNCHQSKTCDQFDGTCVGGCSSGWTGQKCEKGEYKTKVLYFMYINMNNPNMHSALGIVNMRSYSATLIRNAHYGTSKNFY